MSDGTYGKTRLIDDVTAATQGLTRKQVETVVNATLETIGRQLKAGNTVTITGFGTFSVRKRAERTVPSVGTGQRITVPAGQRAHWKPSPSLLGTTGGGSPGQARAVGSKR